MTVRTYGIWENMRRIKQKQALLNNLNSVSQAICNNRFRFVDKYCRALLLNCCLNVVLVIAFDLYCQNGLIIS